MKTFRSIANGLGAILLATLACAAAAQAPSGKSLGASAGLMVYPLKNQKPDRQAQDEAECYNWSKQQSGYDPMSPPPPPVAQPVEEATGPAADGSRARGAARGAVAGAVIGEVAGNDAGKGAAVGATAGVLAGGRQSRKAQEEKQQQAQEQAEAEAERARAAQQELVNAFKRGMAVCLEARNYSVK